ncbi:hypothetical protein BG011_008318 [Mortierella polycephala]|uniref:Cas12f1-like TNB domain-containing protein n=1 Tax=Mortierella polycephala TaxID=41804 RepID=A0A9P6PQC2_9FUNG|nr:hypothetical protein BG011_008318 [Mortierella polycephala]
MDCIKSDVQGYLGTLLKYGLAHALGYIVVGVNEYYTSKKCPTCRQFVVQVEIRKLYCKTCKTYMHRDVMAGHNICNIVRGYLMHQRRPLYLQPVDAMGNYIWEQPSTRLQTYFSSNGGGSTSSSSTGNSSSSSSTSTHSSLVSSVGQDGSLRLKRIASEGSATSRLPKRGASMLRPQL